MQKTKDMKKVYLLLGAVLVTAVLFSCNFSIKNGSRKGQRIKVVNKDVKVQSFEKVEIAGAFDVTYRQGDSCTVRIEAPEESLKELDIYTDGETLHIGPKRKNLFFSLKSLNRNYKIYVYATSPDLTSVEIAGSGEFDVNDHLDTDNLELSIAGSGDIKIADLICDELDATIAGSGDLVIKKMVTGSADFSIAGSGDVEAKDIDCGVLAASIAGSGDMKFGGRTKKYDESIAGSGKVEKSGLVIGK